MNGTNKGPIIKIVALLLAVVLVFVGGYFVFTLIEGNYDGTLGDGSGNFGVAKRTLDGQTYVYDYDKTLITFMGIDGEGVVKQGDDYRCGRQADTIFLIAIDDVKQEVQFLQIDRDTICGVQSYGDFSAGDIVQEQIALAYAYGKEGHHASRNVIKSLSALIGLPTKAIENYFVVAMDGIDPFVSACGGIEIDIPQDKDYTWLDASYVGGATVRLTGEKAYKFIHERLDGDDGRNRSRMERHKILIPALMDALAIELSSFSGVTDSKWDTTLEYTDRLMGNLELLSIANQIKNYTLKPVITATGRLEEPADPEDPASFYVDADDLNRLIIELCFKKEGA